MRLHRHLLAALLIVPSLHLACGGDDRPARDTLEGSDSSDTTPADTTPADTTPADTTPADTTPADTTPSDTTPADTTPADTTPSDTTPADASEVTDVSPAVGPNVSEYLAASCPVKPAELRVSTPGGAALVKLTLDAPEALCNDGSPGIAYVRAATDAARSKRWVFHLQGGGGCASHDECTERWCGRQGLYDAAKMSSRWAKPTIGEPGLFHRIAGNPSGQWNQVFVYYCTSDSWVGQREIDLSAPDAAGDTFSLHARGHQILAALLTDLDDGARSDDGSVTLPRLADAEVILWTGASAGSNGATHHLDWVADRYPQAEVAGVFDAGYGPSAEVFSEAVAAGSAALAEANYQGFYEPAQAFYDTSCLAANPAAPWRCSNSREVKLEYTTTPFFQRLDLRDPTSSKGFMTLGATLPEWSAAARDALVELSKIEETAAEKAQLTRTPGVYGPSCQQHIGTMSDDWYEGATVESDTGEDLTYRAALLAWIGGDDVFAVDTAPASTSTCRATTDDR